jgi:Arc/MetJ-type ribon-helix-helix transcriptional regulator
MSYAFPPDLDRLISERMATGLYASQDELLLDALQALDELERRHHELREEVQRRVAKAGQGLSAPLDVDALMAEGRRRLNAQ